MLDNSSLSKITISTDRTNSFKAKGNLLNYFKMPYNDYSKVKDHLCKVDDISDFSTVSAIPSRI